MWRLLDHGPGLPRWNMAVDEILRRSHAEAGGPPTLRFYQWSRPTLSLGVGQKLPAHLSRERLQTMGLAVVRRPSGGRAVLHGGDMTYCLVAGERDGFQPRVSAVYQLLCQALQSGLARLGVTASPGAPVSLRGRSFDCFAGTASGDLTWQGKKFLGSAQAWQGRSFLQHGAILLTPPPEDWLWLLGNSNQGAGTSMISLAEILGAPPSLPRLKTALEQGFQEVLGITFQAEGFSPWEENLLQVTELATLGLSRRDGLLRA